MEKGRAKAAPVASRSGVVFALVCASASVCSHACGEELPTRERRERQEKETVQRRGDAKRQRETKKNGVLVVVLSVACVRRARRPRAVVAVKVEEERVFLFLAVVACVGVAVWCSLVVSDDSKQTVMTTAQRGR
jgi:hypothetical protein